MNKIERYMTSDRTLKPCCPVCRIPMTNLDIRANEIRFHCQSVERDGKLVSGPCFDADQSRKDEVA